MNEQIWIVVPMLFYDVDLPFEALAVAFFKNKFIYNVAFKINVKYFGYFEAVVVFKNIILKKSSFKQASFL